MKISDSTIICHGVYFTPRLLRRRKTGISDEFYLTPRITRNNALDNSNEDVSRLRSISTSSSKGPLSIKRGILPIYDSTESLRFSHRSSFIDGSTRFPKLEECAHFHYDLIELTTIKIRLIRHESGENSTYRHSDSRRELIFTCQVTSNCKSWMIQRDYPNFRLFDRLLHKCVFNRRFSHLPELQYDWGEMDNLDEFLYGLLSKYLNRFSDIVDSKLNCGPLLNWLELDNRGNRLLVPNDSGINTPAVGAAHAIKKYNAQASDEISLEVNDIVSIIDMPPSDDSCWWRGKRGFEVGFFPADCVQLIKDKASNPVSNVPLTKLRKPLLRKNGKLAMFFRTFFSSRPSRIELKQSGIVKERVFGCDLGEHLLNAGLEVPLVLKVCCKVIEDHGIVDGIYRLSGINSNIQKLRLAFDENQIPDLAGEPYRHDIHSISSLIKMYLRELPNPLLTYQLYDKFAGAVQGEDRLARIHDVVRQLPPPHYRTAEFIMRHLAIVASHGGNTGMHARNLAIVWAPNLLRSKELEMGEGAAVLKGVGIQAVITEYLICYCDLIFSDKLTSQISGANKRNQKKPRPKSLAISTPTRLLSLEEAREKALAEKYIIPEQKYIDVGGGPESLPARYHTVLNAPGYKKKIPTKETLPTMPREIASKVGKSPSSVRANSGSSAGWKMLFSKGRNSSIKDKSKKSGSAEWQVIWKERALTEDDLYKWKRRRLRTSKSVESLASDIDSGSPTPTPSPSNNYQASTQGSLTQTKPSRRIRSQSFDCGLSNPSNDHKLVSSSHFTLGQPLDQKKSPNLHKGLTRQYSGPVSSPRKLTSDDISKPVDVKFSRYLHEKFVLHVHTPDILNMTGPENPDEKNQFAGKKSPKSLHRKARRSSGELKSPRVTRAESKSQEKLTPKGRKKSNEMDPPTKDISQPKMNSSAIGVPSKPDRDISYNQIHNDDIETDKLDSNDEQSSLSELSDPNCIYSKEKSGLVSMSNVTKPDKTLSTIRSRSIDSFSACLSEDNILCQPCSADDNGEELSLSHTILEITNQIDLAFGADRTPTPPVDPILTYSSDGQFVVTIEPLHRNTDVLNGSLPSLEDNLVDVDNAHNSISSLLSCQDSVLSYPQLTTVICELDESVSSCLYNDGSDIDKFDPDNIKSTDQSQIDNYDSSVPCSQHQISTDSSFSDSSIDTAIKGEDYLSNINNLNSNFHDISSFVLPDNFNEFSGDIPSDFDTSCELKEPIKTVTASNSGSSPSYSLDVSSVIDSFHVYLKSTTKPNEKLTTEQMEEFLLGCEESAFSENLFNQSESSENSSLFHLTKLDSVAEEDEESDSERIEKDDLKIIPVHESKENSSRQDFSSLEESSYETETLTLTAERLLEGFSNTRDEISRLKANMQDLLRELSVTRDEVKHSISDNKELFEDVTPLTIDRLDKDPLNNVLSKNSCELNKNFVEESGNDDLEPCRYSNKNSSYKLDDDMLNRNFNSGSFDNCSGSDLMGVSINSNKLIPEYQSSEKSFSCRTKRSYNYLIEHDSDDDMAVYNLNSLTEHESPIKRFKETRKSESFYMPAYEYEIPESDTSDSHILVNKKEFCALDYIDIKNYLSKSWIDDEYQELSSVDEGRRSLDGTITHYISGNQTNDVDSLPETSSTNDDAIDLHNNESMIVSVKDFPSPIDANAKLVTEKRPIKPVQTCHAVKVVIPEKQTAYWSKLESQNSIGRPNEQTAQPDVSSDLNDSHVTTCEIGENGDVCRNQNGDHDVTQLLDSPLIENLVSSEFSESHNDEISCVNAGDIGELSETYSCSEEAIVRQPFSVDGSGSGRYGRYIHHTNATRPHTLADTYSIVDSRLKDYESSSCVVGSKSSKMSHSAYGALETLSSRSPDSLSVAVSEQVWFLSPSHSGPWGDETSETLKQSSPFVIGRSSSPSSPLPNPRSNKMKSLRDFFETTPSKPNSAKVAPRVKPRTSLSNAKQKKELIQKPVISDTSLCQNVDSQENYNISLSQSVSLPSTSPSSTSINRTSKNSLTEIQNKDVLSDSRLSPTSFDNHKRNIPEPDSLPQNLSLSTPNEQSLKLGHENRGSIKKLVAVFESQQTDSKPSNTLCVSTVSQTSENVHPSVHLKCSTAIQANNTNNSRSAPLCPAPLRLGPKPFYGN